MFSLNINLTFWGKYTVILGDGKDDDKMDVCCVAKKQGVNGRAER